MQVSGLKGRDLLTLFVIAVMILAVYSLVQGPNPSPAPKPTRTSLFTFTLPNTPLTTTATIRVDHSSLTVTIRISNTSSILDDPPDPVSITETSRTITHTVIVNVFTTTTITSTLTSTALVTSTLMSTVIPLTRRVIPVGGELLPYHLERSPIPLAILIFGIIGLLSQCGRFRRRPPHSRQ